MTELDCIDFGTLVKVDPIIFRNHCDTTAIYQYLGATTGKNGRVTCRFLGITNEHSFLGEPGDVEEWIDNGWMIEADDSEIPEDAIVLEVRQ
ncbi:hypothetical protein [Phormidesmis sp. 146-33]